MTGQNLIPSTCLFNNQKVEFKLIAGSYENIITFLESNNIYFLATMALDFTNIPIVLHGKGNSKNILEYLANNTNDDSLISKFLNYFLNEISDIRYLSNKKMNFYFNENLSWQNMTFEAYPPYIPETTTTSTTTTSTTTTSTTTTTAAPAPVEILRKGSYIIYDNVNTEMTVNWQNFESSTDTISWGTTTGYTDGTAIVAEYGIDFQHKYTITGLTPGVKYYYNILINSFNHPGSFIAAPDPSTTSLKFLAYGDTRTNVSSHNSVAEQMITTYTAEPGYQSLIISMGDLINDGSQDSIGVGWGWDYEFFNQSQPSLKQMLANSSYMSAVGNHDFGNYNYEKYFQYPYTSDTGRSNKYYTYIYGPVQFFVLDNPMNYTIGMKADDESGSTQYNWFVSELSTSTKAWKVVYYHRPGWSGGGSHSNYDIIQNVYQPLFEQYGVHITFAGDNHYYTRAFVSGVTHITTGGGGAPLNPPDLGQPNIITGTRAFHFCKIDIVDVNIMNVDVIDYLGNTIDTFTIDQTP